MKKNFGNKNGNWKENVGYKALHAWVRRNLPVPEKCNCCNNQDRLDAANISGKYLRDLNDWEYICRRCHMKKDNRIMNLLKGGGKAWTKTKYNLIGDKNPNWKGGISLDRKKYMRGYYRKRMEVIV